MDQSIRVHRNEITSHEASGTFCWTEAKCGKQNPMLPMLVNLSESCPGSEL